MNETQTITDGLKALFSDNPVNWLKWLLVFASFVLTFIVRFKFKIDDKVDPSKRLEEKVQKAIQKKHVIEAKLIKYHVERGENNKRTYTGKYEYELDEKTHRYSALFWEEQYPPAILHLYYDKSPKKLFTNEEYHYYGITGLPLVILNFSPFIVGALMVWLLGLAR